MSQARATPVHNTHQAVSVTIAYRWHPLCGQTLPLHRRENRGGRVYAVVQLPDGTLCALPTWMTDPSACATMTIGPSVASCDAFIELLDLITRHIDGSSAPTLNGRAREGLDPNRSDASRTAAGRPNRKRAQRTDHGSGGATADGGRNIRR